MKAPSPSRNPLAMQRPPSPLKNELGAIEPISYYRQIRPIVEKSCVPCHQEQKKGPQDMRYESLKEDSFWFSGGMAWNVASPYSGIHGGTRTIPGRFGARASRLGKALMDATHRTTVSEADRHAMIVWLDCNSLRLGAYHREAEQLQGTLVWPDLDVDAAHPQGTEGGPVSLRGGLWHENRRPRSILCGTHRDQRVDIIDDKGVVKWFFKGANPQDVWMLPDGHVLVAWQFAVQEIVPDLAAGSGGTVVWEYRTEAPNEIPTCQPLPDGRVLIGIVGQCRLVEVDRQGTVVHTVQLATSVKEPHAQFRLCRKTAAGTYLVPFTAEGAVREYAADGSVIRTFPHLPSPVGVLRLPDGNTLISAGGRVTEYDAKDRVVWQMVPNDIPDIAIGVLAGIQRMPDGSTVVCNWGSSDGQGKIAAHIFCVGHDQRLLWQITGDRIAQVAQCRLLDGEAPLAK